jgi:hypothetical protein
MATIPKMRLLRQGRKVSKSSILQQRDQSHVPLYDTRAPDTLNAFTLFQGKWASAIPGVPFLQVGATLFDDDRISWLVEELGDISGKTVLELGPLEAGHSFMLEKAGAKVTAIEANSEAFLKCLIVKNYFDLDAHILLGDFSKSFGPSQRWDVIVASGVLYHQVNPVSLLEKMGQATDNLFLWTHYFEPDTSKWNGELLRKGLDKWDSSDLRSFPLEGSSIRGIRYTYKEASQAPGFCGGPELESTWLFKSDLLEALRILGYEMKIAFDAPNHVNGPSMCVLARRPG